MKPWDIRPKIQELEMAARRAYRHSELRKLQLWLKGKTLHWGVYLTAASLLLGGWLGLHDYLRSFFYVVRVGEREVGLVRENTAVENFVDDLMERCSALYGMLVEPEEEIRLAREYRPGGETDLEAVQEALRGQITLVTDAVMVTVDGVAVVPVGSPEEVEAVVRLLQETYISEADNIRLLEVSIVERVAGEPCSVPPETVLAAEEAAALLREDGPRREIVLLASRGTNGAEPEAEQALPAVHVITLEELTAIESIPYSTSYTYNDEMWSVQSRVVVSGENGRKEVVYHVTRKNGKEVARQKISETVLEPPVTRVIERGTARVPSRGTGQFIWPVEGGGRLTQGFRGWSHSGIDIASCGVRPRILAADSGVVVKTGSQWPMGNYIIIYHGRYYTLYLHLHGGSLRVSAGDTVEQGQPIALMGKTGRTRGATGVHLHFEIRASDGSGVWNHWRQHPAVDPLSMFRP